VLGDHPPIFGSSGQLRQREEAVRVALDPDRILRELQPIGGLAQQVRGNWRQAFA
jgi:hypothetical protein